MPAKKVSGLNGAPGGPSGEAPGATPSRSFCRNTGLQLAQTHDVPYWMASLRLKTFPHSAQMISFGPALGGGEAPPADASSGEAGTEPGPAAPEAGRT